jgi:hypothetical protein
VGYDHLGIAAPSDNAMYAGHPIPLIFAPARCDRSIRDALPWSKMMKWIVDEQLAQSDRTNQQSLATTTEEGRDGIFVEAK